MRKNVLKRLVRYTKPYMRYIVLSFLAAAVSVVLTLLVPILVGKAVDNIIGKGNINFSAVITVLISLGITIVITSVFQWIMSICTNIITNKTVMDLRTEVFDKINSLPLKYVDSNAHGDIISRMITDIDQIGEGLLQGFTQLFTGIITIIGTLIFMLTINIPIAIIVVILTPLSFFVASFIAKRCHSMFALQSLTRGEMTSLAEEMIGNGKVVKAFGQEEKAQEKFEEINERLYDCGFKAQFYSALVNPSTRFINGIVYAAVGIFGALSAIKGHVSIGQISAFLSYANQYTKPFNEISGVATELQNAIASAQRVFNILDENEETKENPLNVINECNGNVKLQNVDFSYNDKPFIENFNLEAKNGQKIAVVGPTGCGKTTLINLLMRFYDSEKGCITVEGIDIKTLSRKNLRNMYGMVLQDTWLFQGTIFENIAYGKENASMEEVMDAAKKAHAHSFIKRLKNGYNTMISEDGGSLSQGQKQLLSIARVMLTKPPMLILDEATSSIDTMTEIRIQKAFMEMMEGRTSFVVAHRLSTIKEADIIIVMKDGKIIEKGNHEELLKEKGFYYNLYNSQFAPV